MKAAVFDVDGTLVDSLGFWKNLATNYLISQEIQPVEDLNQALETLTVVEGIYYMKEKYNIGKSYREIRHEMDQLMIAFYREEAELKPFVGEILEALKKKKVRMAIASVIDHRLISSVLSRYGLCDYFEFIQTCENTNVSKDDDEFFKILSTKLNLKPAEIFLFEDALYSMKVAKRIGINVVAVEDAYSKKDIEEIIEVSDIYIKDFSKLIPLLNIS